MRGARVEAWERRLTDLLNRIDVELEQKYGHLYPRHPARPAHGTTNSPAHSGLFHVTASFSGGFGSEHGAGYVIDVDAVTLRHVPDDVEEQLLGEVVERLREELPHAFPERELHVSRDGRTFKIHGDLGLGSL